MSILDIANADLNNSIKADMELINVQVKANTPQTEVSCLKSHIGVTADANTGQLIASESITISFLEKELLDKGITLVADESIANWETFSFLLVEQMPDKTLGLIKWQAARYDT